MSCTAIKWREGETLMPIERLRRERAEIAQQEAAAFQEEQQLWETKIEAIVLTTESNPNLKITKRIEIVTAE